MSTQEVERYYTEEEVAEHFGLKSTRHLARNRSRHPHIRIAGEIRYTADHIAAIAVMYERGTEAGPTEPDSLVAVMQGSHSTRGRKAAS